VAGTAGNLVGHFRANDVLRGAVDEGVTFFDTAEVYGQQLTAQYKMLSG
jgi:aryl-alcohol dehydrogenase-like predicted oxidoreductase